MRISALQRIERPSHGVDAHAQGTFPLGQLKLVAQIQIAIFVAYSQHVGMHHQLAVSHARNRRRNQPTVALECAEPNAACFFGGHTHGQRQHVPVGEAQTSCSRLSTLRKSSRLSRSRITTAALDFASGMGWRPTKGVQYTRPRRDAPVRSAATSVAAHEAPPLGFNSNF